MSVVSGHFGFLSKGVSKRCTPSNEAPLILSTAAVICQSRKGAIFRNAAIALGKNGSPPELFFLLPRPSATTAIPTTSRHLREIIPTLSRRHPDAFDEFLADERALDAIGSFKAKRTKCGETSLKVQLIVNPLLAQLGMVKTAR